MCVFLWGELPSGSVQPLKALLCFSGRLCRGSLPCAGAAALPADSSRHCNGFPAGAEVTNRLAPWRPLVLLIPLRLGLTDINEAYVETLKVRLPCPRGDCNTAARCGASWAPPGQPRQRWGSLPAPPPHPPSPPGPLRVRRFPGHNCALLPDSALWGPSSHSPPPSLHQAPGLAGRGRAPPGVLSRPPCPVSCSAAS